MTSPNPYNQDFDATAQLLTEWAAGRIQPVDDAPRIIITTARGLSWLQREHPQWLHGAALVGLTEPVTSSVANAGRTIEVHGDLHAVDSEIGFGSELCITLTDVIGLDFVQLDGPALVQVFGTADIERLDALASSFFRDGSVPNSLLHPAVEVADQCALSGRVCCASGTPPRLYIGEDDIVRTSPQGAALGSIGDSGSDIDTALARFVAAQQDPCLDPALLVGCPAETQKLRSAFLSTLQALRTMHANSERSWSTVTSAGRYVETGDPSFVPRDDVILLWHDSECVVFDARSRRAFRATPQVAELIDVSLYSADDSVAANWLSKRSITMTPEALGERLLATFSGAARSVEAVA